MCEREGKGPLSHTHTRGRSGSTFSLHSFLRFQFMNQICCVQIQVYSPRERKICRYDSGLVRTASEVNEIWSATDSSKVCCTEVVWFQVQYTVIWRTQEHFNSRTPYKNYPVNEKRKANGKKVYSGWVGVLLIVCMVCTTSYLVCTSP